VSVSSYRELVVWQKAMDLIEAVYHATANFPREELYGLTSQLRRASVSVPSNIAEGQGRTTTRDFLYFLSVANGSLKEVETQALIAERLGFLNSSKASALITLTTEVGRLISGLRNSLKRKCS